MIRLSILILITSIGCQHKLSSPEMNYEIEVQSSKPNPSIEMTGKNYFIYWQDPESLFPAELKNSVLSKINREFEKKGYIEVKSGRKGHITVFLNSSRKLVAEPGADITIVSRELVQVNGKNQIRTRTTKGNPVQFQIAMTSNTYGERYKYFANFLYTSNKEDWLGLEDKLALLIEQSTFASIPEAPKTNKKMAGDPGCQPRLGYEMNSKGIITKIHESSPAEKAGLKIGDQLISIDSEDPNKAVQNEEIYKPNLKVPIKFKRGKEVVRSNIQARIMCL